MYADDLHVFQKNCESYHTIMYAIHLWLKLTLSLSSFFQAAEFNVKDAIHIICSLECEEKDELLLALSRAFLSQQLCRGDMHYLW